MKKKATCLHKLKFTNRATAPLRGWSTAAMRMQHWPLHHCWALECVAISAVFRVASAAVQCTPHGQEVVSLNPVRCWAFLFLSLSPSLSLNRSIEEVQRHWFFMRFLSGLLGANCCTFITQATKPSYWWPQTAVDKCTDIFFCSLDVGVVKNSTDRTLIFPMINFLVAKPKNNNCKNDNHFNNSSSNSSSKRQLHKSNSCSNNDITTTIGAATT